MVTDAGNVNFPQLNYHISIPAAARAHNTVEAGCGTVLPPWIVFVNRGYR